MSAIAPVITLTPEDKAKLRNKRWRLSHLYKIIDKNGRIVTFRPNTEQLKIIDLWDARRRQVANGEREFGLRLDVLKDRQIGITTLFCLLNLDEVIWNRGQTAAIIAHERTALEKIFRKVQFAYENMPDQFKPKATTENKNELVFKEIGSAIYVSLKLRSGTTQHLHVSEQAYIPEYDELKAGSFSTVPKQGNISCETTGNGLNEYYRDRNQRKASPLWDTLFFPWTEHAEYVSGIPHTDHTHDEYLKVCAQQQRNWWYLKYDELGRDFDLMKQEYPLTEEDAFMKSGRGIFQHVLGNPPILKALEQIDWSFFEPFEISERYAEFVHIYQMPKSGAQYRAGCDTSGGFSDGDRSAFYIINAHTREIALEFIGRLAPDRYGRHIKKWCRAYNDAFCGIEVNNHGLATINEIKDTYSELYQRERQDTRTNELTKEIGWLTTEKSKDILIDAITKTLRDGDVPALTETLYQELLTFVQKENGKCEAENGCFDDCVMAFGITLMMIRHLPYYEPSRKVAKFGGNIYPVRRKR